MVIVRPRSVGILLPAVLAMFGVAPAAGDDPQRLAAAARVDEPPRIDGKLDDLAWQALPETGGFTCVMYRQGPAEAQTRFRIGYDDTNLYIGIHCDEPRMAEIDPATHATGFDESVELFLDANRDRETYQQFRVTLDGSWDHHLGTGPAESSDQWEAAADRAPGAWTVEISVAWDLLGVEAMPGHRMGLNINRVRSVCDPLELSCWSNTAGGFQSPSRFGDLVLGDYETWLGVYGADRLEAVHDRALTLFDEYPQSTRGERGRIGELAKLIDSVDRHTGAAHDEDSARSALRAVRIDIRRAEQILDVVRRAIIRGEFR